MSIRTALRITAMSIALTLSGVLAPAAPASATAPGPAPAGQRPGFSRTFIDPYWFTNKTDAQLRSMLEAQHRAGIGGIIMQWSAYRYADGTIAAAYPAAPELHTSRFNDAVPRLLDTAQGLGLEIWLGLLVAPNVFEPEGALTDARLLEELSSRTLAVANDLAGRYGNAIDGWYLPIEPNNKTVRTLEIAAAQGSWIGGIADALHARFPGTPVMSSPSMPTAILDGKSAQEFVTAFTPVFERAHVDVWNFQDGYKMTAWSPQLEVAALASARRIAEQHGAEVWAVLYTPGPDRNGTATVTTSRMLEFLRAIGDAGFPLSSFMFASHMNPDRSLPGGDARAQSYLEYLAFREP